MAATTINPLVASGIVAFLLTFGLLLSLAWLTEEETVCRREAAAAARLALARGAAPEEALAIKELLAATDSPVRRPGEARQPIPVLLHRAITYRQQPGNHARLHSDTTVTQ